jgi:hypothetical protein
MHIDKVLHSRHEKSREKIHHFPPLSAEQVDRALAQIPVDFVQIK